jgi:hypothetical protein
LYSTPALYKKYFIDIGIERLSLFKNIKQKFECTKVLYPGSFVHVTPSFYFPEVVYLDLDKRCKRFFSDNDTIKFVSSIKEYKEKPIIRFYEISFENDIVEENEYFDLVISQYSGFISKYCTKYLKRNGILLANDSHGDATLAFTSGNYDLIGIVNENMEIEENDLELYFRYSRKKEIDLVKVLKTMKGPKYKNMCNSYIFRKK